jgi:hypothetical protein
MTYGHDSRDNGPRRMKTAGWLGEVYNASRTYGTERTIRGHTPARGCSLRTDAKEVVAMFAAATWSAAARIAVKEVVAMFGGVDLWRFERRIRRHSIPKKRDALRRPSSAAGQNLRSNREDPRGGRWTREAVYPATQAPSGATISPEPGPPSPSTPFNTRKRGQAYPARGGHTGAGSVTG